VRGLLAMWAREMVAAVVVTGVGVMDEGPF